MTPSVGRRVGHTCPLGSEDNSPDSMPHDSTQETAADDAARQAVPAGGDPADQGLGLCRGRALDESAITLAVTASVRHQDTSYDALLMSGLPRDAARDQVRPAIDRVLAAWRQPSHDPHNDQLCVH